MQASINGITMVYDVAGPADGPAVVLHHPLATTHKFWDHLTNGLKDRYRVLRFDARGHGGSDAPAGPYTFDTLSQDVIGLMDHAGIRTAGFVGLSMGGMVGQHLGLNHADRFNCLVLCATSSRVPPEGAALWDQRAEAARKGGMASQLDASLQRWLSPKALQDKHPAIAWLSEMIKSTPVEGYAGWGGAIKTLNMTDKLGRITLPTRIIGGELDPSTNVAAHEIIHKAIKGSDLVIMKGVAHFPSAEAPDDYLGHVRSFLDKHCVA